MTLRLNNESIAMKAIVFLLTTIKRPLTESIIIQQLPIKACFHPYQISFCLNITFLVLLVPFLCYDFSLGVKYESHFQINASLTFLESNIWLLLTSVQQRERRRKRKK